MTRTDALPKTAGAREYGFDLSAPKMLWAVYVTSPHPHARLVSLDTEEARRAPLVRAVLTSKEVLSLLPHREIDEASPLLVAKASRFQGEPVALVAAETLAAARAAARLVKSEWEVQPAFTDIESEFPEWPDRDRMKADPRVNAHVLAHRGDFDRIARSCDLVHEEVYRTPMVAQVPMEPHSCLAKVTGEDWHVRTTTQTPFGLREDLADKLGLPQEKVRVEGTWVGGGFGGKNEALLEAHALLLSKLAGRPVRLALTFREEFLFTRTTQPAIFRMSSCVKDGRLVARRTRLLLDTGASLPGRDFALGFALGFTLGPYRLEAWELEGYALRTNRPPFGPHRAPLAPQCTFAAEGHLDSLARRMGVDPIEFRKAHIWTSGEINPFGQEVGPFAAAEALDRAHELEKAWRAELKGAEGTGIGAAVGFWSTGTSSGGEAILRLGPKGLSILQGEREIGTGSIVEGLRAIASSQTGLPREAVRVEYADTSRAPFDSGVWGSRTTIALGRAVEKGCLALLRELAARWSKGGSGARGGKRTGAPVLLFEKREVRVRVGDRVRSLSSLLTAKERREGGLLSHGKEYGRSQTLDTSVVQEGVLYPYADLIASVHLAQVAIDRATGAVRVVRYAAFQDAGHVVDPEGYRGQVEGAILMGLGTALTEEGLLTPQGRLLNAGLLDYRVPTIHDVPRELRIEAIEGYLGSGPGGAKGVGEPPIIPVPAAVANAVADATGARVRDLPLTPERVARALGLISSGAPTPTEGKGPARAGGSVG